MSSKPKIPPGGYVTLKDGRTMPRIIYLSDVLKWTRAKIGAELRMKVSAIGMALARLRAKNNAATDSPLAGLSRCTRRILMRSGFNNRDAVRAAIMSGRLWPEFLAGYGRAMHREVCAWLNLEVGRRAASVKSLPSITCPQCRMTSWHPKDVTEKYCGNCHQFHEFMLIKKCASSLK